MPYLGRIGRVHLHFHDAFEESKVTRVKSGPDAGEFAKKGTGGAKTLTPVPNRENLPPHIKALKIPPAWTNLRIALNPDAALLVMGRDKKGHDQPIYSKAYREARDAIKFERVKILETEFPKFQQENDKNLYSNDQRVREHAVVLGLIMATGIRPGSERDTKADEKAFGATTLEGRHVIQEGDDTYLRFVGKKGVRLKIPIEDTVLANKLVQLSKEAGDNNQIFQNISDKSLRDYTHQIDDRIHPKDFRTYLGTMTAHDLVQAMPVPKNATEYKRSVNKVGDMVSQKLGNTRTVALKSYISPFIFAPWRIVLEKTVGGGKADG